MTPMEFILWQNHAAPAPHPGGRPFLLLEDVRLQIAAMFGTMTQRQLAEHWGCTRTQVADIGRRVRMGRES